MSFSYSGGGSKMSWSCEFQSHSANTGQDGPGEPWRTCFAVHYTAPLDKRNVHFLLVPDDDDSKMQRTLRQ